MSNQTLEEEQAKTFNNVIAKYNFTAEGGGAPKVKSPDKLALKPGIRLHFFRYGLFYKQSPDDIGYTIDGPKGDRYSIDEINAPQAEIPGLNNFYIAKTSLNQGYVYLIDDADKENKYFEYEVSEDGSLSTVSWGYNLDEKGEYLDVRKSQNDSLNFKTLSQDKKLWVAYSHHQWSRDYLIEKMIRNDELREKRMILVDCSGIEKGSEDKDSNVVPYTELRLAHYKNHINHNVQKQLVHEIDSDEKNQDEEGDNDIFEDMFIALDDPIGCANDIGNLLVSEYHKLDAIIESIQTGEDEEQIIERLENGQARSNTPSEYEEQIAGLFSSTLTTYQMIYNVQDMEDKYADTTDKSKLLKILAVSERKEQRDIITSFRDDFGNYLSSDYYKKYFSDFTEGGMQELFEGKLVLPLHLSLLAIHPHDKGRHLDLKKDYTGKNDKWETFFNETLQKDHIIDKILRKELKTEDLQQSIFSAKIGFKLSRRLIKCMKSALDAYAKHTVRDENFTVVLDYMKSFTYKNETVIQIRTNQATAAKRGFNIDLRKMIDQDKLVANNSGQYGRDRIRIKTNLNLDDAKVFAANKKIELSYQGQGNKAAAMIKEMMDSPRFRSLLAGLELVNAAVSFNKLSKNDSIKNKMSLFGAVANLTSTSAAYAEAKMLQKGIESGASAVRYTKSFTKVTGFVGSGVSVTMCVWDSVDSYQTRDYDASLVWGLTAVISGILLADGIFAFATGAAVGFLGFWPVLILSILFFGGMFLAIYLTDTPLEKYLKNSVLSDDETLPAGSDRPFAYIGKIYEERTRLVGDKFSVWRDFRKAASDLYDLLISYRVSRKNTEFYSELDDKAVQDSKSLMDNVRDALQMSAGVKYKNTKKLNITIALRKFLYDKSEFQYSLILLPDGLHNTSKKHYLINKSADVDVSEGMDTLKLNYQLSESIYKDLKLSSEFIFLSRTVINENLGEYWPSQDNSERYHAYKFSAVEYIDPTMSPAFIEDIRTIYGINVRIGNESEVLSEANWKLN